jgi:hypothetical protein
MGVLAMSGLANGRIQHMMLYLCRWPNGDVSLVGGRNLEEIDEVLDEVGNPDRAEMIPIEAHAFALHFALKRKADATAGWISDALEFHTAPNQSVSGTLSESFEQAYPLLAEAFSGHEPPDREFNADEIAAIREQYANRIDAALEAELTRVRATEVELSDDIDAAYIQYRMDLPKRLAEEPEGQPFATPQRRSAIIRRVRKPRRRG